MSLSLALLLFGLYLSFFIFACTAAAPADIAVVGAAANSSAVL